MGKYKCRITSDNLANWREFEVDTQSAMKCAKQYGLREDGEIVTVYRKKTGEILSRVGWSWLDYNHGYYKRMRFDKRRTCYIDFD